MSDAPLSHTDEARPPHGLNEAASSSSQQPPQSGSAAHSNAATSSQQQSTASSSNNAAAAAGTGANAGGGERAPPPPAAPRTAPYSFTSLVDSFLQGFRHANSPAPSTSANAAAAAPPNLANATTADAQPQTATLNAGVGAGAPAQAPAPPHTPPAYGPPEQRREQGESREEQRTEEWEQRSEEDRAGAGQEQREVDRAATPPAQLEQPQQQREEQAQQPQQAETQAAGEQPHSQEAQPEAAGAAPGDAQPGAAQATEAPAPHLFRLPITDTQGRAGLLAFTPTPLPPLPTGAPHELPTGGDAAAYVPRTPIFVPFGASPLPFPFLFDAPTNTAWPILPMAVATAAAPDLAAAAAAAGAEGPRFISGPPFLIQLDLHFAAPQTPLEQRPDPEAAAAFVAELETADAELRRRMARLELGDIGAGVGCAICLETYEEEDRPDWLDGAEAAQAQRCVVVPCPGHHTLHHSCLRDWLANSPPDQWACPFCRAAILAPREERKNTSPLRGSARNTQQQQTLTLIPARVRGLREEVRARERQRQWRCDSPACLARYPDEEDDAASSTGTGTSRTTELLKLRPCGHEHHLDCLCTSMKLEQGSIDEPEDDYPASDEEEEPTPIEADEKAERAPASPTLDTVGKWVVCPACRIDAWAQLPARGSRHSKRVRDAVERQERLRREKEARETEGEKTEA